MAAGAPKGVWTNIFASGEQVANRIADDRVQGVALTRSEHAGSIVAAQAGKYLKKSVMELGGADVFVVLEDADVDKAVEVGVEARLRGAGQVCNGARRFVIHKKIADAFLKKFTARFAATTIGDPMDERIGLGPLCSVSARDDLAALVGDRIDISLFPRVSREQIIQGSYWGNNTDLTEVVALAAAAKIRHTVKVIAFDQLNENLDLLRAGDIVGRALMKF